VGDDASVREAQLLTASLHGCSCEQVRLLFREAPLTHATGEDFHLSHMLRKYAGVRSYVLPAGDPSFGGDTDHRLAYSRYSTGGAPTIALREHSRDLPEISPRFTRGFAELISAEERNCARPPLPAERSGEVEIGRDRDRARSRSGEV